MAWPAAGGPGADGAAEPTTGALGRALRWAVVVAAGGIVAACLVLLVAAVLAPEPPVSGWASVLLGVAFLATFPVQIVDRVDGARAARIPSPAAERLHRPLTGWRGALHRGARGTAMTCFALVFVVSFLGAFGVIDDEPAGRSTSTTAPVHRDGDVPGERTAARSRTAGRDGDGVPIGELSAPVQRTVVAFAASVLLALNSGAFLRRTR